MPPSLAGHFSRSLLTPPQPVRRVVAEGQNADLLPFAGIFLESGTDLQTELKPDFLTVDNATSTKFILGPGDTLLS